MKLINANLVVVGIMTCCCCLVLPTFASPTRETEDMVDKFEEKLVDLMDGINKRESIDLFGNVVTLERRNFKSMDSEIDSNETDPLIKRIDEFLSNRRLKIRFPSDGSSADYVGRALGQREVNFEMNGFIHGASEGKIQSLR